MVKLDDPLSPLQSTNKQSKRSHIYIYTRNQVHIGGQNTAGCTNDPIKVYLSTINLYKKIACPQKIKSIDTIMLI